MREQLKELTKEYDKSENDLKALQSVGQIVGEVLKQLTEDKCEWPFQSSRSLSPTVRDISGAVAGRGGGGGLALRIFSSRYRWSSGIAGLRCRI